MGDVGIIVNPWAGKDMRRLHAPAGHTSDATRIATVRRVAVAALECGAGRVHLAGDAGRIALRAVAGLPPAAATRLHVIEGAGTGSALDTRRAASQLRDGGCAAVVVLGGDGTCRDAAIGWPGLPMVPISTGTNNVFPIAVDPSAAGAAAGLVAGGQIALDRVARPAKRLVVRIESAGAAAIVDMALVDVALIDAMATGARAVLHASSIRAVVAAIATPASTGLSSIAGRVRPCGRDEAGAVAIRLGATGRAVRVPVVPGAVDTVRVECVDELLAGSSVQWHGPGVLAFDGERDRTLPAGATATISVDHDGPLVIDVDRTLHCAARRRLFDAVPDLEDAHAP